jgi:hypothetical protein
MPKPYWARLETIAAKEHCATTGAAIQLIWNKSTGKAGIQKNCNEEMSPRASDKNLFWLSPDRFLLFC